MGVLKPSRSNEGSISGIVFSTLWALSIFFSFASNINWFLGITTEPTNIRFLIEALMLILVLLVIVKPDSLYIFLSLSLLQVIDVLIMLPRTPNHRLILFFGNLGFLLTYLVTKKEKGQGISLPSIFTRTRPFLQSLVLLLYVFAFLAKLNSAYINSSISCATAFYKHVTDIFPFMPKGGFFDASAIYSSIVIELALLILLSARSLRPYGILLGLLFHFALALDLVKHFIDFSSVMTALLVAFLPDGFFAKVRKTYESKSSRWCTRYFSPEGLKVIFVTLIGITLGLGLVSTSSMVIYIRLIYVRQIFYTLVIALVSYFIVSHFKALLEESRKLESSTEFSWIHSLITGLILVNGFAPYLGIKTRTTFTMYSNLRIEPDVSNHFFMPKSFDLFGHLSDRIDIEDTNNAHLRKEYLEPELDLTYFEFSRFVTSDSFLNGEMVVYRRNGEKRIYKKGIDSIFRPSWILGKLLIYEAVGDGSEKICVW